MLLDHSKWNIKSDNILFRHYEVKCILFSPAILTKIFVVSGYIASEYLYKGEISTKSDIYSLGLLILETTTVEKNCSNNEPSATQFIKSVREIITWFLKDWGIYLEAHDTIGLYYPQGS